MSVARRPNMDPRRNATPLKRSRRMATTVGELIAAAYRSAYGKGREREKRAAALLTAPAMARRLSRRLAFT